MVRRLKRDVLPQLPRKRRQIIAIDPGAAKGLIEKERYLYETSIQSAKAEADRLQAKGDSQSYKDAAARLWNRKGIAFEDMAIVRKETALAKVPMALSLMEDILENGEKLVVFGYHRDVIEKIWDHFGDYGHQKNGLAVKVDGGMSEGARQVSVDNFQEKDDCRLIVGTLPTMYAVYTLTAASNVLFVELDWRPTRIKQAEDRLDRIGQTNSVLSMHLVFDGSVDAMMAQDIVETLEMEDEAIN